MPFTREEIDDIILELLGYRALGPDGFNGFFVKKAWHIMRADFYKLCFNFYNHSANLKSINHSYITLVPKKQYPKNITDFRPISLLNTSLKIITKILANRLQRVMPKIVMRTSMGLSKENPFKTILDGLLSFCTNAIIPEERLLF